MSKDKYQEKANALATAIDIAIDAFNKFPDKDLTEGDLAHITSTYASWKDSLLNPEPKYRNTKGLDFVSDAVFTPFQEGSGKSIDYFWSMIKQNNLGYSRQNKLIKILKRQKIKNQIEYDFIIDVIVPYQQEGILEKNEVDILNKLIYNFENKKHESGSIK